jgi:hypothetical protein
LSWQYWRVLESSICFIIKDHHMRRTIGTGPATAGRALGRQFLPNAGGEIDLDPAQVAAHATACRVRHTCFSAREGSSPIPRPDRPNTPQIPH